MGKPVSLKPSDAISDSEQLLEMPVKEVIRYKYDIEKTRTANDPQNPLVFVHSRGSCVALNSGLRAVKQLLRPISVSQDITTQTLMHKVNVVLSFEKDLTTINSIYETLNELEASAGDLDDILLTVCDTPSPYKDSLYLGKDAQMAMSSTNRKIINGFTSGTGLEQIEIVTFGFMLVLAQEKDPAIAGTIKAAKSIVEKYRNLFFERRIIAEAWLKIAEHRISAVCENRG